MAIQKLPGSPGAAAARPAQAASNVVKPASARAAVLPVDISELEQKFGWPAGGWQETLLRSADAAGSTAGRSDGKVTVAELDKYLASPQDLKFLTSTNMVKMEQDLSAAGGTLAVHGFRTRWEDGLSKAVDQSGFGNKDGQLSQAELVSYFGAMKSGQPEGLPLWMPDQKQAAFDSKVADATNEGDALAPRGTPVNGTTLLREYMRIVEDDQKRVPQFVSYMLSAADIHERPAGLKRQNNFHQDPGYAGSATPADYNKANYDRGHQKPANDSPDAAAMSESFLMTNMAPQTGALNRQSWRTLEQATNELVQATGGKATIVTGSLFLDDKGQPLPPEQTQYIGQNGEKRVAVPTHFFKTVMLQLPNGHITMYAYLLPNRQDLPTKQADIQKLLAQSRTSVDEVEKLLGYDLYANLPKATQAGLESQATPTITFDNPGQYHSASLLWPQGAPPPPLATA